MQVAVFDGDFGRRHIEGEQHRVVDVSAACGDADAVDGCADGFGFPVWAVAQGCVGGPAWGGEGVGGVFAFGVGGVVDADLSGLSPR